MVHIEQLMHASTKAVADIQKLLAQLRAESIEVHATLSEMETMVANPNLVVYVAKDGETIVGMASLYILQKFAKRTGIVEDVVVDDAYRGQGLGQSLVEAVIERAKREGVVSLQLTSRPSRVAGNKLYQKVGFGQKETNVYRMTL